MEDLIVYESEHQTMFETKTVNDMMKDTANAPDPIALVKNLWNEGEMACLFAESNVGKSIFAVQIAGKIAETQKVLYFDCELDDKQFQGRYTHPDTSEMHIFPENFLRATIAPERLREGDFCKNFLDDLEEETLRIGAKVIILDNLSYACITSEKGDDAGNFMLRMSQIKKRYGWSILVIAHTPKIQPYSPITSNDLAGSKKLFNFFDSVFALGKTRDEGIRYLKQLKYRAGEFTFSEKEVAVFELIKARDGNLLLEYLKRGEEVKLLNRPSAYTPEQAAEVMRLTKEGFAIRSISERTGISRNTVNRIQHTNSWQNNGTREEEIDVCFLTYGYEKSSSKSRRPKL